MNRIASRRRIPIQELPLIGHHDAESFDDLDDDPFAFFQEILDELIHDSILLSQGDLESLGGGKRFPHGVKRGVL
jgi:hypothetical protein